MGLGYLLPRRHLSAGRHLARHPFDWNVCSEVWIAVVERCLSPPPCLGHRSTALVSHVKRRLANAQDMDASGIAIAGLGCCRLATQYALAVFGRFPELVSSRR